MAKQRKETYSAAAAMLTACCVVTDCLAPIVAEVFDEDYSRALGLFRRVCREKIQTRRLGDERFFVCREHLEQDPRMATLHWQWLMF
jgi:hypothetical protein